MIKQRILGLAKATAPPFLFDPLFRYYNNQKLKKRSTQTPVTEKDQSWYDKAFEGNTRYEAHYTESHYYFLWTYICLLYTSPSPRDATLSRMPSSA